MWPVPSSVMLWSTMRSLQPTYWARMDFISWAGAEVWRSARGMVS